MIACVTEVWSVGIAVGAAFIGCCVTGWLYRQDQQ